jgi:hypothetical protein
MLRGVKEPLEDDLAAETTADEEIVDALPVPAGEAVGTPVPASRGWLLPGNPVVTQAATVAVGGFAAGVVTVAAVRHRRVIREARRRRRARKSLGKIIHTKSFLIDVHLLSGRD